MARIRCMAVFQGATNLPEDRFINTFHFQTAGNQPGGSFPTDAAQAAAMVHGFYTTEYNGSTVGQKLSPFVERAYTVQAYDLYLPPGEREPIIYPFTLVAAQAPESMPEEVCVCLTIHGAPPITPRRRGRLYIGPLVFDAHTITNGNATLPSRVPLVHVQSLAQTLKAAASDLISDEEAPQWNIRSVTPSENWVKVEGGWIDDAFDIQRRRGPDPTARLTWPTSG